MVIAKSAVSTSQRFLCWSKNGGTDSVTRAKFTKAELRTVASIGSGMRVVWLGESKMCKDAVERRDRILRRIKEITSYDAMGYDPDPMDDLVDIVESACELEASLYSCHDKLCPESGKRLFKLRKSLEGIFGHDIPNSFNW